MTKERRQMHQGSLYCCSNFYLITYSRTALLLLEKTWAPENFLRLARCMLSNDKVATAAPTFSAALLTADAATTLAATTLAAAAMTAAEAAVALDEVVEADAVRVAATAPGHNEPFDELDVLKALRKEDVFVSFLDKGESFLVLRTIGAMAEILVRDRTVWILVSTWCEIEQVA